MLHILKDKNMNSNLFYLFIIWSSLFSHFSFALQSEEIIHPVEFLDQYEQKNRITDKTKWIIFSREKNSYELITDFLKSKNMTKAENYHGYYVADISKMPRLIAKYFALPEMKKLNFSILIDSNSETIDWPHKAKHFTVIRLKSMKMIEINHLSSKADLESYWPKLIDSDQ